VVEISNRPTLHDVLSELKTLLNKESADIEARIGSALDREKAGTNKRVGWPASTTGSDGGSGGKSAASSTELAVIGRARKDHHRELMLAAVEDISKIHKAVTDLKGRLDSIDDLTKTEVDKRICECCGGKRTPDSSVEHRGTVGDRLTHVIDLCKDCYQFVTQTANPGSRKGYLPSDKQISDHERRGRWQVRVSN